MSRSLASLALTLALLAAPALASGKKEGAGESGGSAIAPIGADLVGKRDLLVPPEQVGESLGTVEITATMMAGAGAGKCRSNFLVFNNSTATVSLGVLASSYNDKGDLVDNWVVNVFALAPRTQTARLFSCALGAIKLKMVPTSEFSWPPVRCNNAAGELEACLVAMKLTSTLPIADKDEPKKDESKAKSEPKKH